MNKQLLIGSLMMLPAGLNAMDWTPYHNLGTVESMRAIAQRQIDEIRYHNEMMARQIQAQNQMTLAIAAEQQAAQAAQAAAQPAPASAPEKYPNMAADPNAVPVRVVKNPPHTPGAIKAAIINGCLLAPETEARYYADGSVKQCFDGTKGVKYYADGRSEIITRDDPRWTQK